MISELTRQKRAELQQFIDTVLAPAPSVQGVVGIGSIANGLARPDSDIDAIVFLDPLDLYIAPAEATWRPTDNTFHSIFSDVAGIQVDLQRLDLAQWSDPAFEWPEGWCGEMAEGWLGLDRDDRIAALIAERTAYSDAAAPDATGRGHCLDRRTSWARRSATPVGESQTHLSRMIGCRRHTSIWCRRCSRSTVVGSPGAIER